MLNINKISDKDVYADDWRRERNGKFTASMMSQLISTKSDKGEFTKGAITYIEGLAGERLTGIPARQEFFNDATDHGNATEPEAILHFEETSKKTVLRDTRRADTHRLIIHDEYCACTPDALVCTTNIDSIFDETGEKLKVAPLETKCPQMHHRYIKLFKCMSHQDLKIVAPGYYWQVVTQMVFCESLIGYFSAYNASFPIKSRIITFKASEIIEDVKKLKDTLHYAKEELNNCLNIFK